MNLPTAVFGISSTNSKRSGIQNFAHCPERCSRSCSSVALWPSFKTTTASGRSAHFSCGIAITAASATAGCPMILFSSSTDEIHSPPDLITSFERSLIWTKPRGCIETMSPVRNQPSSVQRSAWSSSSSKYADATHGPRTSSSPIDSPSQGTSLPSAITRSSTSGSGMPAIATKSNFVSWSALRRSPVKSVTDATGEVSVMPQPCTTLRPWRSL